MHTPLAERNQFFGMQGRITQRFQLSGPTLYLTSGGGVAYGTGGGVALLVFRINTKQ